MALINIPQSARKEDKLSSLLDYLEELKHAFSEIVQEYEDETGSDSEIVDSLTDALDAFEDVYEDVFEIVSEEF